MHKFWYHSPVRFYRSLDELEDMTNPQNTQYFGHPNKPYPLEFSSYHRFLIPNVDNEINAEDIEGLGLYVVGRDATQIPCEFGLNENKLFRVTFISFEFLSGRLEIRNSNNETLFYSNCVEFLNSSDDKGRKFIRIATKNNYNRYLYSFDNSNFDWIITNIPAICLGDFEIDEDIKTEKNGKLGSTVPVSTWNEEVVTYDCLVYGDNNILSFLSIHSTNKDFYIDGTARTRKEKAEKGEYSANVKIKFSNQKDENGMNILLDEAALFGDAFKKALSNGDQTVIYTLSENTAIEVNN